MFDARASPCIPITTGKSSRNFKQTRAGSLRYLDQSIGVLPAGTHFDESAADFFR